MSTEIRILRPGDEILLTHLGPDLFDQKVDIRRTAELLSDPRHHLAVAIVDGVVIGFASAVHYIHPDKPPELWVNEVGVSTNHRQRGLAGEILRTLFAEGKRIGCVEAWVLTDRPNTPAMRLYESLGGKDSDHVMFSFKL